MWLTAALVFFVVLFWDLLPVSFSGYSAQRFLLIGLLTACLLLVLYLVPTAPAKLGPGREVLWFSSPLVVTLFIANTYQAGIYGWLESVMFGLFILVPALVAVVLSSITRATLEGVLVAVLYTAVAGCFFYAATSVMVYLFALTDEVSSFQNYLPWGFVNIRYWSHIATWLLPLLPLAVLTGPLKHHSLWRLAVALSASAWWWLVFLSTARGTALGVMFGVALAIVLIGRPAMPWLKMLFRYWLLGLLIWIVLSVIVPSYVLYDAHIAGIKTDNSDRITLFAEAWRMSLKEFPFGMGPQSWLTHEVITDDYRLGRRFAHPHNMYLMWAAEYGWVFVAALLFWLVYPMKLFWKRRTEVRTSGAVNQGAILAAFTASVSAALFHAGVSAVFMAPGSMLVGALVITIFWTLLLSQGRVLGESTGPVAKARRLSAIVLVAVASVPCGLLMKGTWQYYQAMEQDVEYYNDNAFGGIVPRFWLHGNVPRSADQMPD